MFKKLMNRLGYERFIYHGGDWGAIIGRSLARTFPESVFGLHTTMPTGPFTGQGLARIFLSNLGFGSFVFRDKMEISRWHDLPGIFKNLLEESGYFHEQATKPDTIGVALNNDPAGLAAYILEKFSTLVKRENVLKSDGGLKDTFTKDELITNVMLYWINGCITSSIRIYKEAFLISILDRGAVTVPACAIVAKNEIDSIVTPTLMQESYWDVVNYTMLDRGGHYLAFEEPQVVAQDIINFSKILKTRSSK
jgi:pimeloyl-ACP methyl ester carboxylesterase